jgi:phage-related protein
MSTVTTFVQPITQPLEGLYNAFNQLASQHKNNNDRLRTHKNDLLTNSGFNFQGLGANAFGNLVNSYLDTSGKHIQALDSAAHAVKTCHSDITSASSSADGAGLHPGLTQHILGQVTPNQIIQQGSDPIQAVIDDMRRTLSDMKNSAGGIFSNLFHFHFSSALGDLIHLGGDIKQMAGDVMSLLDHIGSVLTQWASTIYDSVKKCMSTVVSVLENVGQFLLNNYGIIMSGLGVLGKIFEKVGDFMGKLTPLTFALGLFVDVLNGTDKTVGQFFGDLNSKVLGFIPVVGEIGLVIGAFSSGLQLLGNAQKNLFSHWLADGNSFLEQQLAESGSLITQDAKGINFGLVMRDLGGAIYDVDPLEHAEGSVISDVIHHPGDLLDPSKLWDTGKKNFTIDPGAALGDLKKAGGDTVNLFVSDFETGGDIANAAENDYYALRGNQSAIVANNQFTQQVWRPKIDSFKQWVSAHL